MEKVKIVQVPQKEVVEMMIHYGIQRDHSSAHLGKLAGLMEDWCGAKGSVDDFGFLCKEVLEEVEV